MITRRQFSASIVGLSTVSLLLPTVGCGSGTVLNTLRAILKSVERALGQLADLHNLLPDVIKQVSFYLQAVTHFVNQAAELLENEAMSSAQKAQQILQWASAVVLPSISNPTVMGILMVVKTAMDAFLKFFQSRPPENVRLNSTDRVMLVAIEAEARCDQSAVSDWAEHARSESK